MLKGSGQGSGPNNAGLISRPLIAEPGELKKLFMNLMLPYVGGPKSPVESPGQGLLYSGWRDDKATRLAAALAFYTVLSLAPIPVIVIAIAGIAFGEVAVRGAIIDTIQGLVGIEGARAIKLVMENAARPGHSTVAATAGLATLLFGACGVFIELKDSLNTIWDVRQRPGRGIFGTVKDYFFSLSMVVGIGFLLLASLVVSAALSAFGTFIGGIMQAGYIFPRAIDLVPPYGLRIAGRLLLRPKRRDRLVRRPARRLERARRLCRRLDQIH